MPHYVKVIKRGGIGKNDAFVFFRSIRIMGMTKKMIFRLYLQYFVAYRHIAPMSAIALVKNHCWRLVCNKYIHVRRY